MYRHMHAVRLINILDRLRVLHWTPLPIIDLSMRYLLPDGEIVRMVVKFQEQ